jgi:hypothetical protein
MSVVINPICPEGCTDELPIFDFDQCAPEVYFGEIEKIYIAAADETPFTDWNDASEWTTKISNVDDGKMRELTVSADLPAAEYDVIDISARRKVMSSSTFTINITIDDLSDDNYAAMRWTECNPTVKLWFADRNHMYGGNVGITANIMLKEVIERGNKSMKTIQGVATWENKFSPERIENPLI